MVCLNGVSYARDFRQRYGPLSHGRKRRRSLSRISYKTLQTWRSRHIGPPYVRMSRKCIRYRKADLQEYVNSRLVRA